MEVTTINGKPIQQQIEMLNTNIELMVRAAKYGNLYYEEANYGIQKLIEELDKERQELKDRWRRLEFNESEYKLALFILLNKYETEISEAAKKGPDKTGR